MTLLPTRTVLAAFAATDRDITSARAERIAGQLRAYASLEVAVHAAALEAPGSQAYGDLLAYRAAKRELADRTVWIGRLRREAGDLWARAQTLRAEEADDAGRAAGRRLRGEHDLAGRFDRMARAADELATELEAQSVAKMLKAALLEMAEHNAAHLAAFAQPVPRPAMRFAEAVR